MTLLKYILNINDKVTNNIDKFVLLEKTEESLTPIVVKDYSQLLAHAMLYDTEFICSTFGYDEYNNKMMILYGAKK